MKQILKGLLSFALMITCITPVISEQVNAAEKEIDNNYIETIDFSKFDKEVKEDELINAVEETLLNANKYALGKWYTDVRKFSDAEVNVGKYFNLKQASINAGKGTTPEYVYRSPASQAFGLAISIKTGIYDEKVTGVSEEEAMKTAIKFATSVAHEHKSNTGVTTETQYQVWGDDWQAAHWAYYSGYAAWILWDELDSEQQTLVRNMVEYEANRFNNKNALYWMTKNGNEIYKGDTKQEEDSWNSELLNLAPHMMPKHENADIWYARMIEYQLAGFSTPEMNKSEDMIHGKKAKDWVNGYNVNSNGTIVNHGIVHPCYNASATGVNSSIVDSLVGEALPEAARYNLETVYKALTEVEFDCPPYDAPGGTMYREDGSVYYPQGSDWGKGTFDTYANIDVSAYVYGYAKSEVAKKWATLHTNKVLEQQGRFTDGHTYNPGENTYPLNEEAISTRMASAYMTLWLNEQVGVEFSNEIVEFPHEDLPEIADNQQRVFAVEGSYVRDGGNGDTCYYPSDVLEVKKDGPGYARESYVKFNLEELRMLPSKAEIYLPVVTVGNRVESGNVINKVELIEDDNWSEDTLTYNSRPTSTGTVIASWLPNTDGLKIDVTEYIREAYTTDKKLSIKIYSDVLLGGDSFTMYGSPRQKDPNYQPQMLLTYEEDAATEVALIGNENQSAFIDFAYGLEAYRLDDRTNYQTVVEYEASYLTLKDITSETVVVKSVDTTISGKTIATIEGKAETLKAFLQFHPIKAGTTTVKVSLVDNGKVLATTEKTVQLTEEERTGYFVSKTKEDTKTEAIDDTTVRVGYPVGDLGTKKEVDVKTYGNNANTRQAFFKFVLPTKDELESIDTLQLSFYVDRVGDGGTEVRFQYIDEAWDEETLQWSNKPGETAKLDGTAATIPAKDENTLYEKNITNSGWIQFDVTEKAKQLIADGKTEMSLFVYSSQFGNKSIVIRTKEHPEDTHPTMTATYKKAGNVTLNVAAKEKEVNRFDTATFEVSANNVSDIESPVVDITYDEGLVFDSIKSLNDAVNVEVIAVLDSVVRVKLTKDETVETADFNTKLFAVDFKTVSAGTLNVNVQSSDEFENELTGEASVKVMDQTKVVDITLDGEDYVQLEDEFILTAKFDSLIAGVKYRLDVDYADEFTLSQVYSVNQNIELTPVMENGELVYYILEAKDSDKEYVLQLTYITEKEFSGEKVFTVNLMDGEQKDSASHLVKYTTPMIPLEPSKPIVPTTPLEPSTPIDKGNNGDKEEGTDTGDTSNAAGMAGLMLLAGAVIVSRKRKTAK